MPFSANAIKEMLDHMGSVGVKITHASLHSADPGLTGINEISGGSPPYARKSITWNTVTITANVASTLDNLANPSFDVPAGTTIAYVGFWSAATLGTYWGSDALDTPLTYPIQGTYLLSDADLEILPGA